MTGRLLLGLLLLLVVHIVKRGADAIPKPEPCLNKLADKGSPLWKLLCEQLLTVTSRSRATGANDTVALLTSDVADGAENQIVPSHPTKTSTFMEFYVKSNEIQVVEPNKTKVTTKPSLRNDSSAAQESNGVNSRQHKAFFVDYPASQRIYQEKTGQKKPAEQQQSPTKSKKKKRKKQPESEIFFIRLPPTPYSYVPGLGYVSQPPSFSVASLAGSAMTSKPQRKNPFIKLPIDFVSNGKPTAVYRWPARPTTTTTTTTTAPAKQKPSKPHYHHHHHHHHHHEKYKPDSPIIRLNRGPYVFDGRPKSVYLMKRNPPSRASGLLAQSL